MDGRLAVADHFGGGRAVWRPRALEPVDKTLAWGLESLREFRELARDPTSGVRMAPALSVYDPTDDLPESRGDELIPDLRPATISELPSGFGAGAHATLPMIDMPRYLDYLTRRLTASGCDIEIQPVRSLAQAVEVAPIVVNCAGLGARELVGDKTIQPAFGQHIVLANPGLTQLFVELTSRPAWTCYFPHPSRVVCGVSVFRGVGTPLQFPRYPSGSCATVTGSNPVWPKRR